MTSTARSLADALEFILSDKARDRAQGLAEVRRILKLYQSSPEINKVTDDAFHTLFEGLFKAVAREKTNYARASKARQQEITESRLSVCADAIRVVVDASLPRLRHKTLNALTGHFIQVLPISDRQFFEPLSVSYLKTLAVVLGYGPHVEHLTTPRWSELVDLCLTGVQEIIDHNTHSVDNADTSPRSGGFEFLSVRLSQVKNTRVTSDSPKAMALFQCLRHLLDSTCHSLLDRVRIVCEKALEYLQSASSVANVYDAISVLRQALTLLSVESIFGTTRAVSQILTIVSERWRQKTPELRDELLKVLIIIEPHLSSMLNENESISFASKLDNVLEAMIDDYIQSDSRPRRGHLTLEDLSFGSPLKPSLKVMPMQAAAFSLQQSNVENDHNFTTLYFIASFLWKLDLKRSGPSDSDSSISPPVIKKRRKIESRFERSLRNTASASESAGSRIRWSQVVAFVTNCNLCSATQLQNILIELQRLVSSSFNTVAAWALLSLAGPARDPLPSFETTCLSPIGQVWLQCERNKSLLTFLIEHGQAKPPDGVKSQHDSDTGGYAEAQTGVSVDLRNAIVAKVSFELEKVLEAMRENADSSSRRPAKESLLLLFTLSLSIDYLCTHPLTKATAHARLSMHGAKLEDMFWDLVGLSGVHDLCFDVARMILQISGRRDSGAASLHEHLLSTPYLRRAYEELQRREKHEHKSLFTKSVDIDDMDMDAQAADSQNLQISSPPMKHRKALEIEVDSDTFQTRAIARMVLIVANTEYEIAHDEREIPVAFVDHLISLSAYELLSNCQLLRNLNMKQFHLTLNDAERLIEQIARECMEDYEYGRSEALIITILQVLEIAIPLWTDTRNEVLSEDGEQIYNHLVRLNEAGVCSSDARMALTDFLFTLFNFKSDYGSTKKMPSIRTLILRLLSEGNLLSQYHLAYRLPELFGLFAVSQHDLIFDDVHNNLPKDEDFTEGLALRVLILSLLAARWSTLLRRCVYHIFETAALVTTTIPYATSCVVLLAQKLGLSSPKVLFSLQAPQIIYTRLQQADLGTIPHAVFGFRDLVDLLRHSESEFVSQIVMRGYSERLVEMQRILGVGERELLQANFIQTTAYCVASDVCTTGPEQKTSHAGENRITNVLGKTSFTARLKGCLPETLAFMAIRAEHEEAFEKALEKHYSDDSALDRFRQMKMTAGREQALPPGQQPSFKTKYLLEAIERLCRRLGSKSSVIWTQYLTTLILRKIFDDMHSALGPFHTRRSLRRIRIIVCLAGRSAVEGYPLEFLLHSLRPYLADSNCATEAFGIYQYLMEAGKQHLSTCPSFVTGTSLSVHLGLRKILRMTQDSTTQDSEHIAMLTDAQTFRTWLNTWLDTYKPVKGSESFAKHFSALMQAARNCEGPGSSSISQMHESKLLQFILDDVSRPKRILTPAFTTLCIQQLCCEFEQADSYRSDLSRKDTSAARFCRVLWQFSTLKGLDRNFLLWIGKVVARAFRSESQMPKQFIAEASTHSISPMADVVQSHSDAQSAMIGYLLDHLRSEKYDETVLAERALRDFLRESRNDESNMSLVPQKIIDALEPDNEEGLSTRSKVTHGLSLQEALGSFTQRSLNEWCRSINLAILGKVAETAFASSLIPAIEKSKDCVSSELFPFIFHFTLQKTWQTGAITEDIAQFVNKILASTDVLHQPHQSQLISTVKYLWTQPWPDEKMRLDRHQWLMVDLAVVAEAANRCKMFKTSLYFLELCESLRARQPRRSSTQSSKPSNSLLVSIFRNIGEPDAFHSVAQGPDLDSIADRLAFDGLSSREILFRGAQSDSRVRAASTPTVSIPGDLINALAQLNMSSLSYDLGLNHSEDVDGSSTTESVTNAAMKLKQWDLALPTSESSPTTTLFQAYQTLQQADDRNVVRLRLDKSLENTMQQLRSSRNASNSLRCLTNLLALNEADEILSASSEGEFLDAYKRVEIRRQWTEVASSETVQDVLTSRETLLGIISSRSALQKTMGIGRRTAALHEIKLNLQSSETLRSLGSHQQALNNVAYLSQMLPVCEELGLRVQVAIRNELSNVLWEQGELASSIRILKELSSAHELESQNIRIGRAEILAMLGHRVSAARSENPDDILDKYLLPARQALQSQASNQESGRVYHEFATYCHAQLSNKDLRNEFERAQDLVVKRTSEIQELEGITKGKAAEEQKQRAKVERNKAKRWLELDRNELQRIATSREKFLRQSLENYMLALAASSEHDTDVLRFVALWLEHATDVSANNTVANGLREVPSHKLASLMNQFVSRLQEEESVFQDTMIKLVEHICIEHPYHGMYHVYAGCNTKGGNDPNAISRNGAAQQVAAALQKNPKISSTWTNLSRANDMYIRLAAYRSEALKSGHRYPLKNYKPSRQVENDIPELQVPPITLAIPTRADRDYSSVPVVSSLEPSMSIANGLSAPKIITANVSDGTKCKQLFKAGSDDLRQDAIMEQVFEVVSTLLQTTRVTRLRDLGIRTYKVIPLNANAGAIEFVPNTTALLDYVKPAHQRYNSKDVKWEQARQHIDEGRGKAPETRLKLFRQVTERFQPVLRHFFFENFQDPEDWYERRLAYTRSTASISILGHALGLGDRHCQNILLDKVTGEVVHIDLGVAFEAGRVLTIPEVVPFRLTRDIVDGMGVMGVEGVFRRCCEFTLEALRNNRDAIMTLLNVLRYDPLYSWSMSPLRARRLQNEQKEKEASEREQQAPLPAEGKTTRRSTDHLAALVKSKSRSEDEERRDGGEADRALSVVERKLSPTLSLSATVNELIQEATDERNLAMLFCGWGAWA
ncbi:MAG: hypothetical protein Q9159_007382 [Coniocarpon cinnabarinum]